MPPSSSAIVQDISALQEAGRASLAYFYFDLRDEKKKDLCGALASILIQLSARSGSFCEILSHLHVAHDDGAHQPSTSTMIACLKEMLALPEQGPVFIILDALDECPNTSGIPSARDEVLDFLKDLVSVQFLDVHICVTSRPEMDIRTALEPLALLPLSIHDQEGQKEDIEGYIEYGVTSMRIWSKEDKEEDKERQWVIDTLSEKADGM